MKLCFTVTEVLHDMFLKTVVGWVGLTSGWSFASGLLLTVWDSYRRIIRRHGKTILIRPGRDGSSALVPLEVQFGWKLGKHCTYDGCYLHQVSLACILVFASEPRTRALLSGIEDSTSKTMKNDDKYSSVVRGMCVT